MTKTILVAGGAGFIGSHLCEKLLNQGNKIICLDNLFTGNKENIKVLKTNEDFKFIRGDTRDNKLYEELKKTILDQIYDLASPASVTYITEHPIEVATVNSIGTKNLLDLAVMHKAKFLFASSSEAYGDPKEHPQKESYRGNVNPVGVRSGYDEGKRFGEALCMAYQRELGVDVKIARIFNTYGPNSSPNDTRIIPQLVSQALTLKPLTVHGDGQQTRSFCYVSDMVEGLIRMMESSEVGPINLGNTEEFKVMDMAKKILGLTGSKSKIIFVERPEDDPSQRRPDITLARERLLWEPKVALEKGLVKTIEYFREIL